MKRMDVLMAKCMNASVLLDGYNDGVKCLSAIKILVWNLGPLLFFCALIQSVSLSLYVVQKK